MRIRITALTGRGRIRTSEGVSQRVYSPSPLATRAHAHLVPDARLRRAPRQSSGDTYLQESLSADKNAASLQANIKAQDATSMLRAWRAGMAESGRGQRPLLRRSGSRNPECLRKAPERRLRKAQKDWACFPPSVEREI